MQHTTAKPVYTTGQACRYYVRNHINFTNSNGQLYGTWLTPNLYVVYSYGPHWPLFVYDATLNVWYENEDRASRTTSKHRSQTFPFANTELRSCGWLRTYINSQRFGEAA